MHENTFAQLGLIEPILKALQQEGYTHPTPIQAQSIPFLLEGRDLLGCAQTGTGKTAAFAIPMIQRLVNAGGGTGRGGRKPIRALILTPTRELAIQIDESFKAYGRFTGLRTTVIFGGVGQKPQTDALRSGVDILVATPGRLLDLMNQGYVHLKELEYFVLDEADRMLDMGFIHDVKKVIAAIPRDRQTLFFSATMPPEVQRLSASLLTNPVKVEVTPVSSTAETVQQEVYFVDKANKANLLVHLLNTRDIKEALVFSRTKHGADKLVRVIEKAGIRAEAIHGNKAQNARQRALNNFKERKTRVLVATDIAARGIDIDSLGHVVNFDIPNVPETYVHRIGRTGRAGASGVALSLCDVDERVFLRDITKLIARQIPVVEEHPFPASGNASKPLPPEPPKGQRQGGGRNNGRTQGGRGNGPSNGQANMPGTDFAALTAELLKDLDGAAGNAKPQPNQGGQRNNRRSWHGPRRNSGGGGR
ncbi:MAG: DEAD/DEAH box helicase [Flavobacteriales bacterium]|nr:DEAD/DEAH box helicase [Flavobacteriales bacterium]MBP9080868.1 DEAD/DEAH box helicase [Flavobacteriales bacterium]